MYPSIMILIACIELSSFSQKVKKQKQKSHQNEQRKSSVYIPRLFPWQPPPPHPPILEV